MRIHPRIVSVLLLLAISNTCVAQEIKVTDFFLDQSDMTANQQGTMVFDQNGEKCALFKIITTGTDFRFDVGSLGIRKVEQKPGEIWLYVPFGVKKIKLNHQKYGYCEYPIGMAIEKARTYIMKLYTKAVTEGTTDNFGQITVNSDPEGAEVYLDGINVGFTPYFFEYIIPGTHKVSLRKVGYYDAESSVDIKLRENSIIDETMVKSCDIIRLPERIDITTKNITFSLVKVVGGSYLMGATSEQSKARVDESPVHKVTLSDYYIGETEVTNALWAAIMGSNPSNSSFNEPDMPVNNVSWHDCQKFINRLSSLTGLSFFLPTEAQWEFAARGGNKSRQYIYAGGNNPKDVSWYKKNSGDKIKRVKGKSPNELGLYDMSGNVWEWCSDWYAPYKNDTELDPIGPTSGSKRVNRGGAGGEHDRLIRVSCRDSDSPDRKSNALGMRLVMMEQ